MGSNTKILLFGFVMLVTSLAGALIAPSAGAGTLPLPDGYITWTEFCRTNPSALVSILDASRQTRIFAATQYATTVTMTPIGGPTMNYNSTAMSEDGVVYAIQNTSGNSGSLGLVVVSADGVATNIGTLALPDGTPFTPSITSGTIIGSTYYVFSTVPRQMYTIDLDQSVDPSTPFTIKPLGRPFPANGGSATSPLPKGISGPSRTLACGRSGPRD